MLIEPTRSVERVMESDYVFPLVRGRDVGRWVVEPSLHILLPQAREEPKVAVPEAVLARDWPLTFDYFKLFEADKAI